MDPFLFHNYVHAGFSAKDRQNLIALEFEKRLYSSRFMHEHGPAFQWQNG
jgi:hypothetical protein